MIELNKAQTRSLSRLFSKVEFNEIAFTLEENGDITFRLSDYAGRVANIRVNEEGRTARAHENHTVQS